MRTPHSMLDYFKGLGVTGVTFFSLGAVAVMAVPVACISWKCVKSAKSKKGPQQPQTIVVTTSPNMLGNAVPAPVALPSAPPASISHDPTVPPPYHSLHKVERELENIIPPQFQLPEKTPVPFPSH